jgi:molybdopterin molybdotransferase
MSQESPSAAKSSAPLPGYEQAAEIVATRAAALRHRQPLREHVGLNAARGRVLAQPLHADRDQPPFARSTRDGFACRAAEASAHAWLEIDGAIKAGDTPAGRLEPGTAWEIMTGAPGPDGAEAVAMVEHVEVLGDKVRLVPPRTLRVGENFVSRGAEARAGDLLLDAGAEITFAQIAIAATCGFAMVEVYRRPRVAILTTGDELVPVDAKPGPAQVRNSNAPMLAALVEAYGGEAVALPPAADEAEALDAALAELANADMLLISGGVSAGKFDLVEPALLRAGAKFHFTGVRIQPGKPLVFGETERLPFFGLPGNPVSSAVTFLLFGTQVLAALAGNRAGGPKFAQARLSAATDKKARPGLTRFLPGTCTFAGTIPEVELVPWQGSGDLAALSRSNCFLVIPEDAGFLEAGETVRILLP